MQRCQVDIFPRAATFLVVLLCAVIAFAGSTPNLAVAGNPSTGGQPAAPKQVVLQYFAGLATHRYYAAHLLEAPCSHRVSQPPGYGVFQARFRWIPGSAQLERRFIHTIRVKRIAPYHRPLLTRGHMRGFRLYGYFSFAPPQSPAGNPNEPTTLTKLTVFTWQCSGRWWVDPQWLQSSREFAG